MDYTVKEGDTLSEILYNVTGNGSSNLYNEIAQANNISNADHITPGQVIHIDEKHINSSGTTSRADMSSSSSLDSTISTSSSSTTSSTTTGTATETNTSSASATTATKTTSTGTSSATNTSASQARPTGNVKAELYDTRDNRTQKSTPPTKAEAYDARGTKSPGASAASATSASSSASNATSVATPSYKKEGGGYRFTSQLEDEDHITMDIDAARNYINGTMDADLGEMCSALATLIADLGTMQGRQYSTSGTAVDEDYKDFEAITEALSDFLVECNKVLDDINIYINSIEAVLYN